MAYCAVQINLKNLFVLFDLSLWIDRQRESNVTTTNGNNTTTTAAASSRSVLNSSSSHDDTAGPFSSASVALTVALHEASTARLADLQVVDETIAELRTLIRNMNVKYTYLQPVPKDLFASNLVFHLYQQERSLTIKGIYAELELQRSHRLELLKTHQDLHVQGLVAQMRWFK